METEWPPLYEVRQEFDRDEIADARAATTCALARLPLPAGGRIAITAGSRGIDRLAEILGAAAEAVRRAGGRPFVLAAMGSHGGATEAGQLEVLASYGVTEAALGCPVAATTEVRQVGSLPDGTPVFCNRLACEADGVLVVNRVKPHTILTGGQGSGLMKMMAIGLGGPRGADTLHSAGLGEHVLPAARAVRDSLPLLGGVAVVENGFDRVCALEAVPPEEVESADARLLDTARALLPNIPFDPIDLLVVRRMGKNISGAGMDPNVVGMHRRLGGAPDRRIERIVALDLTEESHGNAIGVGMADAITERLRARIDWQATNANGLTSGFFGGIKLPVALPTERDAIAVCLKGFPAERARVALIHDTAHLDRLWVSALLAREAAGRDRLTIAPAPVSWRFSDAGDLVGPG